MEESFSEQDITFIEELFKTANNVNSQFNIKSRGVRVEKIVNSFTSITAKFKRDILFEIKSLKEEIRICNSKNLKLNGMPYPFDSGSTILQNTESFSLNLLESKEVICLDRFDKNGAKIVNQIVFESNKKSIIPNSETVETNSSSKKMVLLLSKKKQNDLAK